MPDTGITTYIGGAGSMLPQLNWRRIFLAGLAFVILLAVLALSGEIFVHLDADQIMVIQAPFSGQLTWHTNPGLKWQGFGKVTKYPKNKVEAHAGRSG